MVNDATQELELCAIVRATPWLMHVLALVQRMGPPQGFVAAGAVRDTVWDVLSGRAASLPAADIDVVYCDVQEPPEQAQAHQAALTREAPSLNWEVTNQAWVHLWYARELGVEVAPLHSVEEGLATWPETATAVGVRLAERGEIELIAPLGLEDLFARVVRHNPGRASAHVYLERIAKKRWAQRWPELRILPARGYSP